MADDIRIEVRGREELQRDLEKAARELPPGMERAMGKAVLLVEEYAKTESWGRPGPEVRTGRLRASITPKVQRIGGGVRGTVGSNVEYAPYVELGTRRMPPYPYLWPALRAKTEEVIKVLDKFLKDVVTKLEHG